MVNAVDILSLVRISEVYSALTGVKPKHAGGGDSWLGPATWRGGDGLKVSLRDGSGVWYDYVAGEGGGILDLVVRVRGGDHREALKWVAEFAGVELADRPMSAEDKQAWKDKQVMVRQHLPVAQLWRRAIVILTEETLTRLKSALFDPTLPSPGVNEIYSMEQLLARLKRVEGIELINEFKWWKDFVPGITEALIKEARKRELAETRALYRFIRSGVSSGRESELGH